MKRLFSWAFVPLVGALVAGCGGSASEPAKAPSASETLRVTNDRIDGRLWLNAPAARAIEAGAGPLSIIGADVATEGDRIGAFVSIPAEECLLAIARGSPTVNDVDLFAYEDNGDPFATDESPSAEAALVVCPPHPKRLYVVGRVMGGVGALAVGAQSIAPARADAVALAVGARARPGAETGRLDSWPGLEMKLRRHRDGIGGRWEDVRRMALAVTPRAPTRVSVPVEAGRCVDLFVTPSDEVGTLEVVVEDETARIVARAKERGRDRALVLCSALATELSLAIRPRGSQGLVAAVVGRSALGAELELSQSVAVKYVTETRELTEVVSDTERSLLEAGLGAPKTVGTGIAKVGTRSAFPLELPTGCARIDVLAGKPLALFEASLWDDAGNRLAEVRDGAHAVLHTCGGGGSARIDLEALARPGPFQIQLRKTKLATPALVAHPAAASRLLSRLDGADMLPAGGGPLDVEVVSVNDATRATLTRNLAGPGCVDVFAALDRGGSGLDMRLVDTSTGESVLSAARHTISNRVCAQGAAAIRIELRLAAGQSDALVWTRQGPP